MSLKTFYLVLCSLSLLLSLYIYIKQNNFDWYNTNFNINKQKASLRISKIIAFQRDNDLKLDEVQNCTDFNIQELNIDSHKKWQKIGKKSGWFIYSAYLDKRLQRTYIRILALSKGSTVNKLYCKIWYNSTESSSAEIHKQELWIPTWNIGKEGEYYHPFLLTCPTLKDPIAVSIIENVCDQPANLIYLTSPETTRNSTLKNFVVCLKPMSFHHDISLRLLEWLELHFLLGLDNAFVYIYKAHQETWKVLKYYERTGKVTIRIYRPPDKDTSQKVYNTTENLWQKRRYEMLIYNDCFYRHIHSHTYVVNVDIDELIVPMTQFFWLEMLKQAQTENTRLRNSASMSVRNVYFFDKLRKFNDTSEPSYMHMLQHIYRSANFTPPGFAQKSFFSTNLTLMVSNHFALQTLRQNVHVLSAIGDHLAHLHHYRNDCPPLMEKDCEDNYMKYWKLDTTIWKYKSKLVQSVQEKIQKIGIEVL